MSAIRRTHFAQTAFDYARVFEEHFGGTQLGGACVRRPHLGAPEGMSTDGGRLARQHITLRPVVLPSDAAPPSSILPESHRTTPLKRESTRPESAQPESLRADSLRPDSLRPDSLRPDSLRPDSLRPDSLPPGSSAGSTILVGTVDVAKGSVTLRTFGYLQQRYRIRYGDLPLDLDGEDYRIFYSRAIELFTEQGLWVDVETEASPSLRVAPLKRSERNTNSGTVIAIVLLVGLLSVAAAAGILYLQFKS